jgi:hypothetical protein
MSGGVRARRLALPAVIGGSLVWLCSGSVGTAAAESPDASAGATRIVRVLSPKPEALVTTGSVVVSVRTSGRVARLEAWLRGRKMRRVDARFGPARNGVRRARFRLGNALVQGRNHLFVKVRLRSGRTDTRAVHFTVAKRQRGLLRLLGAPSGPANAPLHVRAIARPAGALRARLNGRDISRLFLRGRGARWRADIAAQDGLRFGRNRLVVTAFSRAGRYERIRRTFRIRRVRPLVGAGRDRRVRRLRTLRLDGRSTRAARRGSTLRLRWRIVSRPRGSKATLRRASSRRPLLRSDVRGRYRIRLEASERGGRRGRAAAAAARDTVNVVAQPNVLPEGIPITTLDTQSDPPDIELGPATGFGAVSYGLGAGDWVQLLALDRATLALSGNLPRPSNSYPGTDQGIASLKSDLSQLSSDDLVILSAGGQPAPSLSATGQKNLVSVVQGLGAVLQPGTGTTAELVSGQWSLIGVPGLPQGTAYQAIGVQANPNGPAGSLSGFLQLDTNGNFTFTWPPAFLPFDTQASGTTANQNVISIGSQTYTSAPLPSGMSGFHVVWLDSGTLAVQDEWTALNIDSSQGGPCSAGGSVKCMDDLAIFLEGVASSPGPEMLVVASIGKPAAPGRPPSDGPGQLINFDWGSFAQELNGFGAQPLALGRLDGTGDYSFLGIQGLLQLNGPSSGAELAQPVAGSESARLTGLLQRNRQGNWMAGTTGSPTANVAPEAFQPSLQMILSEPDQPFQPFSTPGEQAAQQYIALTLGACQNVDGPPPTPDQCALDPEFGIRAGYWQNPNPTVWQGDATTLSAMSPCTDSPCSGAFDEVRQTLLSEFNDVALVNGYFYGGDETELFGLLSSVFTQGSVSFLSVASDITSLYDPPSETANGPDAGGILNGAMTVASGASGFVPVVGGEMSGAFGIAAGVQEIVQATSNGADGSPALDPGTFQGDIYDWGTNLNSAWTTGLGGLGSAAALLVSDAGRLEAAAAELRTNGTGGGWKLDNASITALRTALGRSLQQYMWGSMLPVPGRILPCATQPPSHALYGLAEIATNWVVPNRTDQPRFQFELEPVFPTLINFVTVEVLDTPTANLLFSKPTASNPNPLGLEQPYFFGGAWITNGEPSTPGFRYLDARSYSDICDL